MAGAVLTCWSLTDPRMALSPAPQALRTHNDEIGGNVIRLLHQLANRGSEPSSGDGRLNPAASSFIAALSATLCRGSQPLTDSAPTVA